MLVKATSNKDNILPWGTTHPSGGGLSTTLKYPIEKEEIKKLHNDNCSLKKIQTPYTDKSVVSDEEKIEITYFSTQEGAKSQEKETVDSPRNIIGSRAFGNCLIAYEYNLNQGTLSEVALSGVSWIEQMENMLKAISSNQDFQSFCEIGSSTGTSSQSSQQTKPPEQIVPNQPQQSRKNVKEEEGNPFNIFGINPFETWLNLNALAEARASMATGALDRFTEATVLHSVGLKPTWEKDALEKEAIDKFNSDVTERFIKLNGKTSWGAEITDTTKRVLIETVKDPVTIKKDSAVIELFPFAGEKGVLETGSKPTLKSGAVDIIFEPQNDKQFEMQTPNIELLVIGTEFSVIYNQKKGETLVAVYKGQVEVKTKNGKTTTVSPNGDKPGVVVVAQKLSVIKLTIAVVVLAAVIGGVVLILRKRLSSNKVSKKRK